jgi:cobyrinic acid a,c-diamide synthase
MGMPVTLPRLLIAAPSSGAGKTTIAVGLMPRIAERFVDACVRWQEGDT